MTGPAGSGAGTARQRVRVAAQVLRGDVPSLGVWRSRGVMGSVHGAGAAAGVLAGGEFGAGPDAEPAVRAGRSRAARARSARMRRVLAALLAGISVWLVAGAALPRAEPSGIPVVVAARELAAGTRLEEGDLITRLRPESDLPAAALRSPGDAVGRLLAGPVTAGEVLTAARLQGRGLLSGMPPGRLAVAVPLADSGLVGMLRAGDAVRVLAPGSGATVAEGRVLVSGVGAVESTPAGGGLALGGLAGESPGSGGRVVIAVAETDAAALAAASGPSGLGGGFVLALLPQ